MLSMIMAGTTFILGHGIKGQGQLWYFVYKKLLPRNIFVFMRRPGLFGGTLYTCSWVVRMSGLLFVRLIKFIYLFARYFLTLTS